MCSDKDEIVLGLFQQIEDSILLLQQWNKDVKEVDDYLLTPEGMKNLAATCMIIEAIGESIKKIDKRTNGELLPLRSDILISMQKLFSKRFRNICRHCLMPFVSLSLI